MLAGDIDRLMSIPSPNVIAGADDGIRVMALGFAGRFDEARERLLAMREHIRIPTFNTWLDHLTAFVERRAQAMLDRLEEIRPLKIQDDPEAMFTEGWLLCDVGEHAAGFESIRRAVTKGYFVAPTLKRAPQFDALRGDPAFDALVGEAEAGRERALATFRESGGERLLGT
jgi:hypothetical protein